ncbi:MAG TPA: adenylate/guanylate cyclase domain-containing protein [Candidatus Acidoferrum sp.]|nr:adenylate/guanylate cyclase domain-containing protein [Candidatus Acidoferrum sp.]
MDRKLAAILAADVVGYSRLMERDEAGTFERLRAQRKALFEPTIAAHHGRIFKLMGDGLLAEFASVVDAVECAVALQQGMAEHNAVVPENQRFECRIGVNLGDVIVEKDPDGTIDVHGEGVIIANRLQAQAEPGAICVTQTVANHVGNKIPVGFEFQGEQRVKNVAQPLQVYRVLARGEAGTNTSGTAARPARSRRRPAAALLVVIAAAAAGASAWWHPWSPAIEPASIENMALPLPDRPSIAVLPFTNMSSDPKQEYFADGMTDDLITELSKVSGLFVISRNSTFVYKGRTIPPKQVSEELGVRYVLEGSVQRSGDQLRINAQLIDALSGGHAWADRFDGSLADVFALQDKVTRSIADALAIRLTEDERQIIGQQETGVPAAYDAFLRGWELFRRGTAADSAKAVPYFEQAIHLDPDYGRAYAALSLLYFGSYGTGWNFSMGISGPEARGRGSKLLAVAQNLDQAQKHPSGLSHQAAGLILWTDLQADKALAEFRAALVLEPGDAWTYAYMSGALTTAGQPAEAVSYIRTAMRLDPRHPPAFHYFLGMAQFASENFDEAAASLETATRLNRDDEYPFAALGATYGHLGRKGDAQSAIARFDDIWVERGGIPLTIDAMPWLGFARAADLQRLRTGFRLAGVPETLFGSEFAARNRIPADEIRTLFFGHRLHGRRLWLEEEHAASVTAQGAAEMSGDWVMGGGDATDGIAVFDGDELCLKFGVISYCGLVLRNPGGTKAKENEFIWLLGAGSTFSQTD